MSAKKTLSPVSSRHRLDWLIPTAASQRFPDIRDTLRAVLERNDLESVYDVNERSIYVSSLPALGCVGIKELRFPTAFKQFAAARWKRHRIYCEYWANQCFRRRGGKAPEFYAAVAEPISYGIQRVFFIFEWIESSETLSQALKGKSHTVQREMLAQVVDALIDAARCGLVHGRHSSENLLLSANGAIHTIDFSHAQLFPKFHRTGFVRDAARIAARLTLEQAADDTAIAGFFERINHAAQCGELTSSLKNEYRWCLSASKRVQKARRRVNTVLRGTRWRLSDD